LSSHTLTLPDYYLNETVTLNCDATGFVKLESLEIIYTASGNSIGCRNGTVYPPFDPKNLNNSDCVISVVGGLEKLSLTVELTITRDFSQVQCTALEGTVQTLVNSTIISIPPFKGRNHDFSDMKILRLNK